MKKTFILLAILCFIMTALVGLLIFRAYTNDLYFAESQASEDAEI